MPSRRARGKPASAPAKRSEAASRRSRSLDHLVKANTHPVVTPSLQSTTENSAASSTALRQRHEESLRLSEARLRAVLENAVDSIITIDERGLIQSVNPATERMFGYTAQEMIGRNVSMLMPSPYREEHDDYLVRYLRTGEKRIIGIGREVEALKRDGSVFPVDLAVSEVEAGRLFTGIIRDISDRRIAEARLREADRMASIGSLAAGLGHDMNNVLLPVRAHLNAAKVETSSDSRREHLDRIQKGVAYLQQLADGLHFLAMDPDEVDEGAGATDLGEWWTQTGPLLSKAVPKHVKVIAKLPAGLPKVAVAAHALTQAVLNLIVNAGEAIHTPAQRKHRQGYVRLSTSQDGRSVRLAVTDNGAGMSGDVMRRAFDMFFTTKQRGLGTGLGLALVRKVVDRAGGSVEIKSELGKGTTVTLTLSRVEDADRAAAAAVVIGDGRAASLVTNLLQSAGGIVVVAGEMARADVLVVEPNASGVKNVAAWRQMHPHGGLVLFGQPDAAAAHVWKGLKPVIVEDTNDFEAVRAALSQAISAQQRE